MRLRLVLVAFALGSACSGPGEPAVAAAPEPAKCSLHGDVLLDDEVRVLYGLVGRMTISWADAAPNAMPYAFGGCCLGEPVAKVQYCPTCRRLYDLHWRPR